MKNVILGSRRRRRISEVLVMKCRDSLLGSERQCTGIVLIRRVPVALLCPPAPLRDEVDFFTASCWVLELGRDKARRVCCFRKGDVPTSGGRKALKAEIWVVLIYVVAEAGFRVYSF